jgi:hypothetical protein
MSGPPLAVEDGWESHVEGVDRAPPNRPDPAAPLRAAIAAGNTGAVLAMLARLLAAPNDQQSPAAAEVAAAYGGLDRLLADLRRLLGGSYHHLVAALARQASPPIPSGPRPVSLPSTIRLPDEATEQAILDLLGKLQKRWGLGNAGLGTLAGDELVMPDGNRLGLLRVGGFDPQGTVSGQLAEGVYLIDPVPRAGFPHIPLLGGAGPATIRVPNPSFALAESGLLVAVTQPGPPRRLLVYAPRALHLQPVQVTVSPPANLDALERRLVEILDGLQEVFAPLTAVDLLLYELDRVRLNPDEVLALCERLRDKDRLGELFNLVQVDAFRQWLREHGLHWTYIYANWQPSVNDSALCFSGFLIGAGETYLDGIKLAYMLAGSFFFEDLRQEREQFIAGIKAFIEHPVMSLIEGFKQLMQRVEDALWELRFFDVGRILGYTVASILTLATAVTKIPKIAGRIGEAGARALAALDVPASARGLAQLGPKAVAALDVPVETLRRFLQSGEHVLELGDKLFLRIFGEVAGADNLAVATAGQARGVIPSSVLLSQELDDAARAAQRTGRAAGRPRGRARPKARAEEPHTAELPEDLPEEAARRLAEMERTPPSGPAAPPKGPKPRRRARPRRLRLGALVDEAVANLRQRGISGRRPGQYGTLLHQEVDRLLRARNAPPGYQVFSNTSLKDILPLPPATLRLTVRQWFKLHPEYKWLEEALPRELLEKTKIGKLKPDLAIRQPDGSVIIWDLTSRSDTAHFAKTTLYAYIAAKEGVLVSFAETYWRKGWRTLEEAVKAGNVPAP